MHPLAEVVDPLAEVLAAELDKGRTEKERKNELLKKSFALFLADKFHRCV